ncbi:MAG: class I adenylate-forming enzyme family protein [Oscillospiraceae bacterium]|nr:class I adenylate-forming enzyme family protein [Oscillospiraceae bacterium]
MLLHHYLERNADKCPEEVALVEINPSFEPKSRITWREYSLMEPEPGQQFRREMTWGTFEEKANKFANLLFTRGVEKGDKVAILLMNSIEWLPIYFGILKTGAIAVPLNYRYAADEIKYCLEKSDSSMLVFGPEFIGRIEEIVDRIPQVENLFYVGEDCPSFADSFDRMIKFCSSERPDVQLTVDDDAAIYFSSGTTGFPKAILHAHRSLEHAAIVEQKHHGQQKDDVFLCIPPLYHTGAKMHWMGSLVSCSRAVLLKGTKPEWIIRAVSDEKCTIVWLLVPWAQDILDTIDRGEINIDNYCLSQWRLMHIGAQPVPPALIKRWLSVFPHHQYDTNYGLSESIGPGCIHLGVENVHKVGAIGIPGYGWKIKLVDENDNEVKPGEVGEICISGAGVMKCYYKDEEATKETLKNGWLYSGDMGMVDEDGFIHIVDRKKDVIISGGENLYPVQIENFIRANIAVKDVAVIGTPDERLGEIATAVIEVKEGYTLTEEEVNEFCLGLPRYKRPRKIIFADIPRNPTGKIEKPTLRKIYCGESVVAHQVEDK